MSPAPMEQKSTAVSHGFLPAADAIAGGRRGHAPRPRSCSCGATTPKRSRLATERDVEGGADAAVQQLRPTRGGRRALLPDVRGAHHRRARSPAAHAPARPCSGAVPRALMIVAGLVVLSIVVGLALAMVLTSRTGPASENSNAPGGAAAIPQGSMVATGTTRLDGDGLQLRGMRHHGAPGGRQRRTHCARLSTGRRMFTFPTAQHRGDVVPDHPPLRLRIGERLQRGGAVAGRGAAGYARGSLDPDRVAHRARSAGPAPSPARPPSDWSSSPSATARAPGICGPGRTPLWTPCPRTRSRRPTARSRHRPARTASAPYGASTGELR